MKDNNKIFYTEEYNNLELPKSSTVKVYQFNNSDYVEVTIMSRKITNKNKWKKISKTEIQNIETGEIKTVRHNENRSNNISGMVKSQRQLVRIINANFSNCKTLHFILTYSNKQYDIQQVYKDFSSFRKKLKYRKSELLLLAIYEPHKDGSFHIHLLIKNSNNPYQCFVPIENIKDIWKLGNIKFVKFNSSAAPYFCKKERLHFYNVGNRLYTKSRGLITPEAEEMNLYKFENRMKNYECISKRDTALFVKEKGNQPVKVNEFSYRKYKRKN